MNRNAARSLGGSNKVVKNVIFGFGTKLAIMLLNIIIPRLFIVSYGSEMNGLLSTITQIFTYLALLEAGIGSASVNALYQPLDRNDREQISQVLGQSRTYYRKVTLYYTLGVLAFAVVYPLVADSAVDKWTIFAVIMLQGAAKCITYYFCAAHTQLLVADGKNYWVDNINLAISVGTSFAKIALVWAGCNVVVVQVGFLAVNIAKIPMLMLLCRKHYPWLRPAKTKRYDDIKDRGAFVVHEISGTIFSNTDVFVISTFCSFALASVYTVYNLVFSALNTMVNTANSGLGFLLGQNYYKDRRRFLDIYDCYSGLYSAAVFIVMTVAYILILPFVRLYTAGVTDTEYVLTWLPLLFTVINLMSGVRAVAARLITVTGHAKHTQNRSILEAVINVVSSLVLVQWLGIYGVLLGTIIALIYRMNDIIIYANKVILQRSPWHEYKGILVNAAIFTLIALVFSRIDLSVPSYLELLGVAVVAVVAATVVYLGAALLVNRKALGILLQWLREKKATKQA